MRTIILEARDTDIFKVIHLEGDEVVKLAYSKQIDDLMISCVGGGILIRWDADAWSDDECMLVKEQDNFKEINGLRCTHLLLKANEKKSVTVYTVAQLN